MNNLLIACILSCLLTLLVLTTSLNNNLNCNINNKIRNIYQLNKIYKTIDSNSRFILEAYSSINNDNNILNILKQAALIRDIPNETIKTVLNDENINELLKLTPNYNIESLRGKWELVLSTITGYLPVVEIIDFFIYSLESSFKQVLIAKITGESNVINDSKPVVIEFTPITVKIGWFTINFPSRKPKTYSFIYVDDEFCLAKSSNGGYSILKKIL